MKQIYIVDYYVPFPSSEFGGLLIVIASSDEECADLIRKKAGYREQKYICKIKKVVKEAIKLELRDQTLESKVIHLFTT